MRDQAVVEVVLSHCSVEIVEGGCPRGWLDRHSFIPLSAKTRIHHLQAMNRDLTDSGPGK
jgi:hypothetical protein